MNLDHAPVAELLGAYALDAVDRDESHAIAAHVEECDECRNELAEHRAVVESIAGSDEESRRRVWSQIVATTTDTPVGRRPPEPVDARTAPLVRLTALAAVALLVMATGALIALGQRREQREVEDELAVARAALELFSDPEASRVELRSEDGRIALAAAIRPDGTGVVVADGLPELPGDRTYQLWMITEAGPVSSGVLGTKPGIVPITIPDRRASALAVTSERAGGARTPTLPIVASGPLPAS